MSMPESFSSPGPGAPVAPAPTGLRAYRPNDEQIARAKAARRFRRLVVYLPIALVFLIIFAFSTFLLTQAIWPANEGTRSLFSGLADLLLILAMLPLLIIFLLLQVGTLIGLMQWYTRRRPQPDTAVKQYGYVRVLLWRVETAVVNANSYVNKGSRRVADWTIQFASRLARIETWLEQIKQWLMRS